MSKAIGLIEFNTTPKGMEAADAMLKASEVQLVFSSPICPGKYITILAGEVDAVRTAISKGEETGGPPTSCPTCTRRSSPPSRARERWERWGPWGRWRRSALCPPSRPAMSRPRPRTSGFWRFALPEDWAERESSF